MSPTMKVADQTLCPKEIEQLQCRERRERKKKKKRNMWGTLKILLQHHWYSQKDFDNDWSEPYFSSKDKWAITMKREGREKKKEEKKRPQNHTKTPITTYWYH